MSTIHEYKVGGKRKDIYQAFRNIWLYPFLVSRHKYLVLNFFRREFYGRFKGSILGVGWVLIHPIFLFIVYYLVFGELFQLRAAPGKPETWYPIYLFSGIVVWMLFSETSLQSCTIVTDNGNLIKKVAFPAELLPFPKILVNLVVFLVGTGVILGVSGIIYIFAPDKSPVSLNGSHVLFFVPIALELALFTLGLSLLLATLHVFIRDTFQVYSVFLMFWFFVTPVFWHTAMLKSSPFYKKVAHILALNPLFNYVQGIRACIGVLDKPLNTARSCFFAGLLPCLIIFVLGCFVFNLYKRRFADEV